MATGIQLQNGLGTTEEGQHWKNFHLEHRPSVCGQQVKYGPLHVSINTKMQPFIIVYGCFCTVETKLNHCNEDHSAYKA